MLVRFALRSLAVAQPVAQPAIAQCSLLVYGRQHRRFVSTFSAVFAAGGDDTAETPSNETPSNETPSDETPSSETPSNASDEGKQADGGDEEDGYNFDVGANEDLWPSDQEGEPVDQTPAFDPTVFPPVRDNREKAHPLVRVYYELREKALKGEAIGEALYAQDDEVAKQLGTFKPDELDEFVRLRCAFTRPLSDDHIRLCERRVMKFADWIDEPEQIALFLELFCTYSPAYNAKLKTVKHLTNALLNFPAIPLEIVFSVIRTVSQARYNLPRPVSVHLYRMLKDADVSGDQWEEDVDVYFSDDDDDEKSRLIESTNQS